MLQTDTDPAMSLLPYANPNLLRYNLEPLFQNQKGRFYLNEHLMHDLGSKFPKATGYVEGNDEYMPVNSLFCTRTRKLN
jgi:hypothetical protein